MITIKANGAEFSRELDDVARQQVPFALANTLSRTAEEAVDMNRSKLPGRFTIRTGWIAKGYRVKHARKDSLLAVISHKDKFMVLQEEGGTKTPTTAKSVAVPEGARPTPSATTPRSKWPGAVLKHAGFVVHKPGFDLLFQRVQHTKRGKVRKSKRNLALAALPNKGKDPNVRLMYVLKRAVKIKPALHLVDDVKETLRTRLAINFDGFLKSAIRSARPK